MIHDLLREAAELGSGATLIALRQGHPIFQGAHGCTRSHDDGAGTSTARPAFPVTIDTRFDLASVTKPLVAAALLVEHHHRGIPFTAPVSHALPEFSGLSTTTRELLTHTAGFPPEWPDRRPDPDKYRFRSLSRPDPTAAGSVVYSCVGYLWAGILAQALAGRPLDEVVRTNVLAPLGMNSTGFLPATAEHPRIAATEDQPLRGMLQGTVHDETAAALGGVTGNAGLFGTASDLVRFLEALRAPVDDGPLPLPVIRALTTRATGRPYAPRQGAAINEWRTLGLTGGGAWLTALPGAVGHTGFTGTAIATQPGDEYSVAFLTNRVHPVRTDDRILTLRGEILREVAAIRRNQDD